MKSMQRMYDLVRWQASKSYNKTGKHLLDTMCCVTSSQAVLPTLPNMAFSDLWKDRLALSSKHLNEHALTSLNSLPRYLMNFTHGKAMPVAAMMFEQPASNRGQMRKQHDFYRKLVWCLGLPAAFHSRLESMEADFSKSNSWSHQGLWKFLWCLGT